MIATLKRREFITLIGGAAFAWPVAAQAQQPDRVRRIGVLMGYPENDSEAQAYIAAFRDGLRKLGWMENGNVRIDYRWATAEVAQIQQQALVANHQSGEHQGGMKRRVAAFIQPSAFSHLMPTKGMSERLKVRVTIKDRAQ